jgi:hypothetical protein
MYPGVNYFNHVWFFSFADSVEWLDVASNIDHEFYVIRNLRPNVTYQFRLAARNRIGWSEKGIPTPLVRTKEAGINPNCLLDILPPSPDLFTLNH